MAMGDPANEPGNPDGCRISKKKISKMASSLANLADMFSRAATLIERAVGSIASSVKKVGKGTGGGGAKGEKVELPFSMKIWEATRKKNERDAKKQAQAEQDRIKAANQAAIDDKVGELALSAYRQAVIDKRKEALEKEEKETDKKIKQLEKFQKEDAARLAKFKREEEAAAKAKEDAANKEAIDAKILTLQVQAYSKAMKDQAKKRMDEEQAARDAESNARKKFFADQEKEIMRQAPLAYSIGKALGFLSGSLFKAASGLFSKGKGAQGKATGGWIQAFASGGAAKGTDTVPAMLTPGEFVVNKKSAQKNRGILKSINDGTQYYAAGGLVALAGRGLAAAGRGAAAAGRGVAAGAEASGMSGTAQALTNSFNMIAAAAGPLGSIFNSLKFAVLGPVDLFTKLVDFVSPFVQAVNPALMQQLGLAFKDLQAVIGTGLQPVIMAAIPIVRAFADRLQPIMVALIPTFEGLAASMIELSGPVIEILIQAFAALEPVIEIVSGIMSSWATMLTSNLSTIVIAIKSTVTIFLTLATTLQSFIGYIATWIPGFKSFGNKMMESADKSQVAIASYWTGTSKVQAALQKPIQRGASLNASAQPAAFRGISEFGKNLMQQAFSSGTQAAVYNTAENTKNMANTLNKIDEKMGRANPAAPAAGVRRGAA